MSAPGGSTTGKEPREMEIEIKSDHTPSSFKMKICMDDTAAKIKEQIGQIFGIPVDGKKLVLNKEALANDRLVGLTKGIREGDTIWLIPGDPPSSTADIDIDELMDAGKGFVVDSEPPAKKAKTGEGPSSSTGTNSIYMAVKYKERRMPIHMVPEEKISDLREKLKILARNLPEEYVFIYKGEELIDEEGTLQFYNVPKYADIVIVEK